MLVKNTLAPICFAEHTPLLELLREQDEAVRNGFVAGIALIVDEKRSACWLYHRW